LKPPNRLCTLQLTGLTSSLLLRIAKWHTFGRITFNNWTLFISHGCHICGPFPGSSTFKPIFQNSWDLATHMKSQHQASVLTPFMPQEWKSLPSAGVDPWNWRCEKCDAAFYNWDDRLDHIASHFDATICETPCNCLSLAVDVDIPDREIHMRSNLSDLSITTKSSKHSGRKGGILGRARAWIARSTKRR